MASFVENVNKVAALIPAESVDLGVVADNIDNINLLKPVITDLQSIVNNVVPNIAEILLADDNAATATTKAGKASTSASEALGYRNEALGFRNEAEAFNESKAFVVDTVEDLLTIPSSYVTAVVRDLNRGGTFIWSATGTANSGTVFAGATGFWNRQYSGAVNVKWFGAVEDVSIDNTVYIQHAIDYAVSKNKEVSITGTYKIDRINLDAGNHTILGNGTLLLYKITSGFKMNSCNKVVINNLNFDGSLYGDHYDDAFGINIISGTSNLCHISYCYFKDTYGSGINISSQAYIKNNIFENVSGFNATTDIPSGANDNYGDAIRLSNMESSCSVIENNKLKTTKQGRAGIVIEFNPDRVLISSNIIDGYDRSIHLELCGTIFIQNNKCINGNTALLLSSCKAISKGNSYIGNKSVAGSYNYGALFAYTKYSGSSFEDDIFTAENETKASVQMSGSCEDVTFKKCTFNVTTYKNSVMINRSKNSSIKNCTINGIVVIFEAEAFSSLNISENKINGRLDLISSKNITVENNIFTQFSSTSNILLGIHNCTGGLNIKNNKFIVSNPKVEDYVITSYLGTWENGKSYFSNNILITDELISQFFSYNSTGNHQPFIVDNVNYKLSPTTYEITPLYFSSKYNGDGNTREQYYGITIPTSGNYYRGDIIYNANPSASGFVGWICVTAGSPGTWKTFGAITA